MSDFRNPPPLFDDDEPKKDDENDIFASAVQSPISDILPDGEPVASTTSHPLLSEDDEDGKQHMGEINDKPFSESYEDASRATLHSDIFESCQADTLSADLKTVSLDNENIVDQVRQDSGIIEERGPTNLGGGFDYSTSYSDDLFESSKHKSSSASDTHFHDKIQFEEPINSTKLNSSSLKPYILSDIDTTEIMLDDTAQEISLDDDGDMYTANSSKSPQEDANTTRTSSVLPPIGAPLTEPQVSPAFNSSFNTPTASAASVSPVSPVTSSIPSARADSVDKVSKEEEDNFIEIIISDPQKIGDGMGSYMSYKVTTKTNIPYFRKKHWSVTRRFSDFLGLHSKLVEKHLHSGVIIPPAPEKAPIATTKIKLGSDKNSDSASVEFIERRRAALERYMNRTAAHPKLRSDPDFREFIELDTDLPKATSTSAISSAGVLRLFNRVGETVNKMTFKMDESDQWFEEKTIQIENLDNQLRKLHGAMEGLVGYRRELANSTGSFSKSAAVLSSIEEHTALSRALHQLSEATDRIHTIHHAQADADFFHLSETTKDYINLIGAVKEVFHERVKLFQTWQHAQSTLAKKRENKAKMELTGRIDKVEQANDEVKEWETKVTRGQEEFERISRAIKAEMDQFDVLRVVDYKDMLVKYLEALISSQLQIVRVWESFLPEAKAIA